MPEGSALEVAHIFRRYGPDYRRRVRLARRHLRVMWDIETCRTAALGGHLYRCDQCGKEKNVYNSCGNRHCPKCQALDKHRWVEKRCEEILPVGYFHVVFTLPDSLRPLALSNQRQLYTLLFQCAWATLREIAADPDHLGADIGMIALLHTWGQKLDYHPHLHCIVPGGGLSCEDEWWVPSRHDFFLPVAVLSRLFRGKFLAGLEKLYRKSKLIFPGQSQALAHPRAFEDRIDSLRRREWVVYSKPPFGSAERVVEYLGRYTHRVAITNTRLLRLEGDQVLFTYRDYRDPSTLRTLSLDAEELIRRFLLHVLPERFVRIRYYGLLAHRHRAVKLDLCRRLLGRRAQRRHTRRHKESCLEILGRLTGLDPTLCPGCRQGHLRLIARRPRPTTRGRSPP